MPALKGPMLEVVWVHPDGAERREVRSLDFNSNGYETGQAVGFLVGYCEGLLVGIEQNELVVRICEEPPISAEELSVVHDLLERSVENFQAYPRSSGTYGYSFDPIACQLKVTLLTQGAN